MTLFDILKETITGRPLTIKEPIFLKEGSSAEAQLKKLEELLSIAPPETAKQIEQDLKMLAYGLAGEKNVAYELKSSYMPILILHDLYLEYQGHTAQIDYVVIARKFVLVIECKKMVGDIEVTHNGDFIRSFKSPQGKVYKKEGIYSPIVQNERHVELIKRLTADNMETMSKRHMDLFKSIVVIANPKTILNTKFAKKEVKTQIIKHEQLINHMKALNAVNTDGYCFSESGMYKIANILMTHHQEEAVDYTKKYRLNIQENKPELSVETEVKQVPEKAPSNKVNTDKHTPVCPKCGALMIKRTATRGDNAGKEFYGCSSFPKCRGIINI